MIPDICIGVDHALGADRAVIVRLHPTSSAFTDQIEAAWSKLIDERWGGEPPKVNALRDYAQALWGPSAPPHVGGLLGLALEKP